LNVADVRGRLRHIDAVTSADVADILRRGLLGLAALGVIGTTVELVFLRHWGSTVALIVWPTMLVLAASLWVMLRHPSAVAVRRVRYLAAVVVVVGALGVLVHSITNFEAAPLDREYEKTWPTMSTPQQVWLAATGQVGSAPTLAPGALVEIALGLMLATVAHPALDSASVETREA